MKRKAERPQNRRMGGRKGATIVEFALVFVLTITMVLGVFELGRAIWVYNSLTHAAKQASRYAMVHGSRNPLDQAAKSVQDFAKQQAVGIPPDLISVTIAAVPDNSPGNEISVTLQHTMNFVVAPLLGFDRTITLRGRSVKTIIN